MNWTEEEKQQQLTEKHWAEKLIAENRPDLFEMAERFCKPETTRSHQGGLAKRFDKLDRTCKPETTHRETNL